jgi:DNA-binding transcriptional MerR regulator
VNGYRAYDENAIKTLRFVRQAQTLGVTLREIRELLALTREGRRPCNAVRKMAVQHLSDIDTKIRRLCSLRNALSNLLSDCAAAPSAELCPLISSAANQQTIKQE